MLAAPSTGPKPQPDIKPAATATAAKETVPWEVPLPPLGRQSHYFETHRGRQFDLIKQFSQTKALEPLNLGRVWIDREASETFPQGV